MIYKPQGRTNLRDLAFSVRLAGPRKALPEVVMAADSLKNVKMKLIAS